MKLRDLVLFAFAVLLIGGWARETFRRTDAERFAAERDSVADVALDSAASFREARDRALEAAEAAEAAFGDSLIAWAARAALANERAVAARDSARTLSGALRARSDSLGVILVDSLDAQHGIELEAAREQGREEGREQATRVLQPQITALDSAVVALQGELGQAYVALEARTEAEDALRRELRGQRRWRTAERIVGLAGWACAALCR